MAGSKPSLGDDLKLCYINQPWAWFTTADIDEVWGDDWDDAPWQHNAGQPLEPTDATLVKVAYEGDLYAPGEIPRNRVDGIGDGFDDGVSVEQINRDLEIPWLVETNYEKMHGEAGLQIWAGETLEAFIGLVEEAGGTVYRAV